MACNQANLAFVKSSMFSLTSFQEKKERDKAALDLTNRMESSCGGIDRDVVKREESESEPKMEGEEETASLKVDDDDRKTWRIVRLMRDIFVNMANKDFRDEGAGCAAPKVGAQWFQGWPKSPDFEKAQ